jgi:lysyl-tRNA synthetase class 2
MARQLTEQERIRRDNLEKIRELGIDPYPAAPFEVNAHAKDIKENYGSNKLDYKHVQLTGRLMMKRVMGKASFAELQDATGKNQLYVSRDDICPGEDKTMYNQLFKKLLDIGDYIGVEGFVFTTRTGEITVHVKQLKLLSKSLRPLPVVKQDAEGNLHDAFTDPQQRYRMRYVDLTVNPKVRQTFVLRSRIMQAMRQFLINKGYLEVETPVLQPIYGGALARPFKTHHHTLDQTFYLRIANELYLKRLIVGGFDGVFEFAKDFRNEGMSRFHNPEFTQMELYVAYTDYEWMMNLTEEMLEYIVKEVFKKSTLQVGDNEISFERPFKRYTMYGSIEQYTGIDISEMEEDELRATAKKLNVELEDSMGKGKIIDEIFSEKCEPNLIQPTFITDYPIEMSPLAKSHREKEGLVERFEVICAGSELSNAFTELNNPVEQLKRFEEQLRLAERGDDEAMELDEDFLRALEYGMPPAAGLGIGIDRLTMIMTDQTSIQEVIFFPQMRPEQQSKSSEKAKEQAKESSSKQ